MKAISFRIYPFISEDGYVPVPDDFSGDAEEYVNEHFNEAVLVESSRDYRDADMDVAGVRDVNPERLPSPVTAYISPANIKQAEQVLKDNGVAGDEADTVLQAIGYALLGVELYKE